MKLVPPDRAELLTRAIDWLAEKENYQWLDFGDGRQLVTSEWLKIAVQRGTIVLRLFTDDGNDRPIGIVGLSNINQHFKSATLWVVLGDKLEAGRGYASRAVSKMLTLGFGDLGLCSINTWIVEHNPSVRVAQRVRFRAAGRLRGSHYIDGRPYDRLLFDVIAAEHVELPDP